jgi:hypothetical protein
MSQSITFQQTEVNQTETNQSRGLINYIDLTTMISSTGADYISTMNTKLQKAKLEIKTENNKKIDINSLIHEKEVSMMISEFINFQSKDELGKIFLDMQEGDINFGLFKKGKILQQTDVRKKTGWWQKSFLNNGIVYRSVTKHMFVIAVVAEIAGLRFEDFPTFDSFSSRLYYLCKYNKFLGSIIQFSTNVSIYDSKIVDLMSKVMIVRERRFQILQRCKYEILFLLKQKLQTKLPSDLIRYIGEFNDFNIENLVCKNCFAKKSIDVALSHTTSNCKIGCVKCKIVCVKCKIMGKPQEIYGNHTTKYCRESNNCGYCSAGNRKSNHFILNCYYLNRDVKTSCIECKNKGCNPRVFKSHNVSLCAYTRHCVYCFGQGKSARVFKTHTIAKCKNYARHQKLYQSSQIYCIDRESFMNGIGKKYNEYDYEENDYEENDYEENDYEENDYEDEEDRMYRTNPGYARYMDEREDYYAEHGYYESDFDNDDEYERECSSCGYSSCRCGDFNY